MEPVTILPPRNGWMLALGSGIITLLLAMVAVFLPLFEQVSKSAFVGWLLLIAGAAEAAFGIARKRDSVGRASMMSGLITAAAGLILVLRPELGFFPVAPLVAAWLLIRGGCLLISAYPMRSDRAGIWLFIAAAADILLGLLLVMGLRITTFIAVLLGPTFEMIASFALVLAVSFAFTGISQIAISIIQRQQVTSSTSHIPHPQR